MSFIEFVDRDGELRKAKPPQKTLEQFVKKEMERAKLSQPVDAK